MTATKRTPLSPEAKVGLLVAVTALFAVLFAWIIGFSNPFNPTLDLYVTYNFAGGVEVGSPVRVSGIKVGKVESVDFFVPKSSSEALSLKEPGSADSQKDVELAPVRLKISVLKKAARGLKADSRFYINMAGIIGERYVEITPGSREAAPLSDGAVMAGVDPPRIDQLISQSFDLAGKITEIVNENKEGLSRSIELLYKLSNNLNKTLAWVDKSKVFKTDLAELVNNLIVITGDLKGLTSKVKSPEGKKSLELLNKLLWRLEPLDEKAVRTFLQKEGVKVQLF